MNIRDNTLGSIVDTLIIQKTENKRKIIDDRISLMQDIVDKITIEDLVDTIIITNERNTIQVIPDTISIYSMSPRAEDLLVINGYDLLQATGMFPFHISLGQSVTLLRRSPLVTMPYLFGGLSLITTGMILNFFKKMNKYLFLKIIK